VRLGDDELEQVCGCSMALDKSKIGDAPYFDHAFGAAGDDVDFSWRLREHGGRIAYAPAAVVTHRPRATVRSYLRQQRGYGRAEGLLYRKYPRRARNDQGVYGGWLASLFSGGTRVYYGAFGRGLFQTLYNGEALAPIAQIPLTFQWVAVAVLLMLALPLSPMAAMIGLAGIVITKGSAAAAAILEPSPQLKRGGRINLALLWLLGPLVRSYERTKIIWSFNPDVSHAPDVREARWHGRFALTVPPDSGMVAPAPERLMEAVHAALLRRGAAVAVTDGYEPYDLEIRVPPLVRVPILILQQQWELGVGWRVRPALMPILVSAAILFVALLLIGVTPIGAIGGTVAAIAIGGVVVWQRLRRLPALIGGAVMDAARQFGLCVTPGSGK
jgi:O-antigen biosynthesis protein